MGAGEEILKALARIEGKLDKALASGGGASVPDIADDHDLDGQYGDPEVRFKPRDWTGDDMKGRHYSACPPEFLDELAKSLAHFAAHPKAGKEDKAKYDARDAARARGWAKRLRARGDTDAVTPDDKGDENVPF